MTTTRTHRRRGSIYILVLGSSMIISAIGLSALMAVRIERNFTAGTTDFAQARYHARSAVEMGFMWISSDPDWRTNRSNGVWASNESIGDGTYSLTVVDPMDGELGNLDTSSIVLVGTGMQGQSRYKLEVSMSALIRPLSCLEVSLHAGNDIVFQSGATVDGDQTISANDTIQALASATVVPAMESVNGFVGTLGPGTTTSGITPRVMPNSTKVFDYYLSNGTSIDPALLVEGSVYVLRDVVLSPALNPYGLPNPEGIYIIDLLGGEIHIRNCRLLATLVILNAASTSIIEQSVNWTPGVANFPALLVAGSINLGMSAALLEEATRGVNFNPVGAPYLGSADGDITDVYPSQITGLVYVTNDLNMSGDVNVAGAVVVGGTMNGAGKMSLFYDPVYHDSPPPGFYEPPKMVVVSGSWQQVVD